MNHISFKCILSDSQVTRLHGWKAGGQLTESVTVLDPSVYQSWCSPVLATCCELNASSAVDTNNYVPLSPGPTGSKGRHGAVGVIHYSYALAWEAMRPSNKQTGGYCPW
jgi:hypothetical protein